VKGIWKVRRRRGGKGLFGETWVEEGTWKVQRRRGWYRVIWGYLGGRSHLEGIEG